MLLCRDQAVQVSDEARSLTGSVRYGQGQIKAEARHVGRSEEKAGGTRSVETSIRENGTDVSWINPVSFA